MEKFTPSELARKFYKHNETCYDKPITAVMVLKGDGDIKERSWRFTSQSKRFKPGALGTSCFANRLSDGSLARIDHYFVWKEWMEKVDYCYIES